MFLYLCKVYVKLDQPMNALDYFQKVEREREGGRKGRREREGGRAGERERGREGGRERERECFQIMPHMFLQGLEKFKNDTTLLTGIARVHEVCIQTFITTLVH